MVTDILSRTLTELLQLIVQILDTAFLSHT